MATASEYKELEIWNESMDLCEDVYHITDTFPRNEQYGLSSQMKRAGVSIPSNIAEGFVRKYPKEFRHHLSIALGSLAEFETQLLIAARLKYISLPEIQAVIERTSVLGKKMTKFYQKIQG